MANDNLEAKDFRLCESGRRRKEIRLATASRIKDFDFEHCPFCGCEFDMHKDFYYDRDLKYRHAVYLFKCHECHTLYEVLPVVTCHRARRLDE